MYKLYVRSCIFELRFTCENHPRSEKNMYWQNSEYGIAYNDSWSFVGLNVACTSVFPSESGSVGSSLGPWRYHCSLRRVNRSTFLQGIVRSNILKCVHRHSSSLLINSVLWICTWYIEYRAPSWSWSLEVFPEWRCRTISFSTKR